MNYDISASMNVDDVDALVRLRLIECCKYAEDEEDVKRIKAYRRVIKDFSSPSEWEEFKNNY